MIIPIFFLKLCYLHPVLYWALGMSYYFTMVVPFERFIKANSVLLKVITRIMGMNYQGAHCRLVNASKMLKWFKSPALR